MSFHRAFETEIRTNNGDDPLDPWYRYFKWTLQNFPQGGKGSNLSTLLDRFFQFFQSQTKYHNDHRLVEIWLQTVCCSLYSTFRLSFVNLICFPLTAFAGFGFETTNKLSIFCCLSNFLEFLCTSLYDPQYTLLHVHLYTHTYSTMQLVTKLLRKYVEICHFLLRTVTYSESY